VRVVRVVQVVQVVRPGGAAGQNRPGTTSSAVVANASSCSAR
jgi:hypothetical protein